MKRNEILAATLFLGGLLLVPAATAQAQVELNSSKVTLLAQSTNSENASPKGNFLGKREGTMCDLTDSQLEKMVALRDRFHIATATKEAELKSIFHQTAAQLALANIDKTAISDLHSRAAKLHRELSDEHLKMLTESAEILTPEQRQKMYRQMLKHSAGPGSFHHMPPPFMGLPPMPGFPPPPNIMRFGPPMGMGGPGGFPPMHGPSAGPFGTPPDMSAEPPSLPAGQ